MVSTTIGLMGREAGLAELKKRQEANVGKQIDNDSLPAGSPMYFYCTECGALSDKKPENYDPNRSPVKNHCSDCRTLIANGWLAM